MPKDSKPPEQPDPAASSFEQTAPPNIPRPDDERGVGGSKQPELDEYDDIYIRKSDGEKYALAISPNDIMGRTHKAQNTKHYWEGTEPQFRDAFTEEDGSPVKDSSKVSKKKKK